MIINLMEPATVWSFHPELAKVIDDSRFKCNIEHVTVQRIKLKMIRLKSSKEYCGNHPDSCEIETGPSRKGNFLEGRDWVEFNDMLNDLCDDLGVEANIASSVCKVRKGSLRRIYYGSHLPNQFTRQTAWNKDEPDHCWDNYIGQAHPNSSFPEGTPGIYKGERVIG